MHWVLRFLWAVGWALAVWLVCEFVGGFCVKVLGAFAIAAFVGGFVLEFAIFIAAIAFIFAFVGGPPLALVSYLANRRPGQ